MVKNKDYEYAETPKSYLMLEDGSLFEGKSFGAHTDTDGEIGNLNNSINLFFLIKNAFWLNQNFIALENVKF